MTTGQPPNLAFTREEFSGRLRRTREGLVARGLDAGIFFAAESIYYLSGYDAPSHFAFQLLVVPVDQAPFMVMRQHMASGFWATSWLDQCITFPDGADTIEVTRGALVDRKLAAGRLGLEEIAPPLTVQTSKALVAALPDARFSDCSGIVETLRLVKSPREIDCIRKGAQVCDVGMVAAREAVAAGVSEEEIAAQVTRRMILAGGEYQVMPVLVGIEEHSRLAIPLWTSRRLSSGELLWVEVFGGVRRYSAGLKATFGARPASGDAERRAETVLRALQRAIDAVAPSRAASVVAETVHETFREAGYGEYPHHQSGYSMGITFSPTHTEMGLLSLRRGNAMPLQEGMTLHPIANLYGRGPTIGASHMILVTATGAEKLTRFEHSVSDLSR